MEFAYPYLLLVMIYGSLAVYAHFNSESQMKTMCVNILSVVVFVFFFGLRGFVAYDWTSYYPEYQSLTDLRTLFTLPLNKWTWEPGFMIFGVICKTIYPNYFFFQFLCILINVILLMMFFRRYVSNIPLAFMIMLVMSGFEININLVRNSISILLFVNAIVFIEKKQFLPFLLVCLLGFTFHSSSLAYIPMYFIINRKFNKYIMMAIFAVANVIYLFHIPILKSLILLVVDYIMPSTKLWVEAYLSMDLSTGSVLSIGYLERLLTGILLFCYIDKLREIHNGNNIFVNSMLFYLCTFLFLSEFRTISLRCSYLFIYAYWIVWIDLIKCFTYRNNKILYLSFVALYSLLKVYFLNTTAMSEYYNITIENKPYNERLIHFRQHFNDVK